MNTETPQAQRSSPQARRRRGFLSIEWILALTILVIGIIGGLSTVRNAILAELQDICRCIEVIEICPPPEPPDCDLSFPSCCNTKL
jgi:hypothetical protein